MKILIRISVIVLIGVAACNSPEVIQRAEFEIDIPADSITFAIIGDYGSDTYDSYLVSEMVKSWLPDFIITTGDNNYPNGAQEDFESNITDYYGDYIYNFDAASYDRCNGAAFTDKVNRFFPSPGNHDVNFRYGLTPYKNYFTLPGNELYYKFTWGSTAFYSLNSNDKALETQQNWLVEALLTSSKEFNLLYFHHPPYSCGDHGSDRRMQWGYDSLGATAVICGHDHLYSRIEKYDEPGLLYLVNGTGGRSLYSCDDNPLDPEKFSVVCHDEYFGAIRGRANAEKMILEFFSVENPEVPLDVYIISSK